MYKPRDFTSIELGADDASSFRSTSLWRRWKRMTSYQKKLLVIIACLSLFLFYSYYFHQQIPSNSMVDTNDHQARPRKISKDSEIVDDIEALAQHPILEQLGKEQQQGLKNLEDRLQEDINKMKRPMRRGNPKLIARKEDNYDDKGNAAMVPADIDQDEGNPIDKDQVYLEVKKMYPAPDWNPPFKGLYNDRQRFIVEMFQHAWKGYKNTAWGHDHSHPISRRYDDWFNVGLTILDALDTTLIMGLEKEYMEAREWIADKLTFDVNVDVNLFECTIRVLGSMLSAYHLTHDELYKDRAVDIGNRLLPAMTRSVSAVPYSDVNLASGNVHAPKWGPDSTVSEVTTIQMEFRDLSFVTKNAKYKDAVDRVATHVANLSGKKNGLVPMWINANSGLFRPGGTLTVGARADSYYEYLLKQWVQTNRTETHYLDSYLEAVEGIKLYLVGKSVPHGYTYVGELLNGVNPSPKMDHLVCFLPGTLALGSTLIKDTHPTQADSHMSLAKNLMETCYQMYVSTPTGLSPEIAYFNKKEGSNDDIIVKPLDRHNLLRPETVESLFYMWRITKDETYREWGWKIAQAFEKYCKVPAGGYSSIKNVMDPNRTNPMDKMESFFLGETLKYLVVQNRKWRE